MENITILCAQRDFVACVKPIGAECEHELPTLLAQALGSTAQDFYCVHRLDRAVGGVMVYARTAGMAAALSQQIQERTFQKEYLAVCAGALKADSGEMRDYLYKDAARGRSFPVKSARRGVKEAVLNYRVLAAAPYGDGCASLVRVALHTGRFHQIRCQFASRRHPLLGDGKYGSREKGCAVALWSVCVAFTHPKSHERLSFSALPERTFPWDLFPEANDLQ